MKPFNLEKCIAGEKVVTRDGREFKFGAYNKDANVNFRIIGWIDGDVYVFLENGEVHYNLDSRFDLFMAEPVLYYAIYRSLFQKTGFCTTALYSSEEELKANVAENNIIEIRTFEPK